MTGKPDKIHHDAVRAAERAYTEGFRSKGRPGLYHRAAEILGIDQFTVRNRIVAAAKRGLKPNYVESPETEDVVAAAPPPDPFESRRTTDIVQELKRQLKEAIQVANAASDIRESVLGLTREPLRPTLSIPDPRKKHRGPDKGARIIVLHLSDLHLGEVIRLEEMDGDNSYNPEIAARRLDHLFKTAISLATIHWTGEPPVEVVLCLGGDMISGDIHQELTTTNALRVPETVKLAGQLIAGGILSLRKLIGCPVRVYTVPGNHARLTIKPHHKGRALNNLDLLVSDFAEAIIHGTDVKDIVFYQTESPDAYFSTFRWNWLLNHGDSMGAGGGQGYIGPISPITKGHRLLAERAANVGKKVHHVLTGHYHTTARTSHGWANGSVIGPSEFARHYRMAAEQAKQNMLIVHEQIGVISHQELYLGSPEEGTIYRSQGE